MRIPEALSEIVPDMRQWRHDLHAHPQTAFEETYASELIGRLLSEWGLHVERGLAQTGVVGTLHGRRETAGQLESLALRADIDALDILERTGLEYASRYAGKMHACGHDGHTAMLLGAARYLARTRDFAGTVHFIFQPAEENEGGGRVMVQEGLFERFPVDAVFGMHNWPSLPLGAFAAGTGPMMAAYDVFTIRIHGVGAHAAMPQNGVDPIVTGAHLVQLLQTIVSRNIDPADQAVLTVTQFHAGDTWNVIPPDAEIRGTVRTFRASTQDDIERRLHDIARHVCSAAGAECTVDYERRYPATVNTSLETDWAVNAAADVVGEDGVDNDPRPCMGSEDFAFMLQERPGCYIWAGSGDDDHQHGVHHPEYDFNDRLLPIGAAYWVRLVERLLGSPGSGGPAASAAADSAAGLRS